MPTKRVIAHFMHERERDAAIRRMPRGEETEAYIVGDIEEREIPGLKQEGLIVQVLEEQPPMETPGADAAPFAGVRRARSRGAVFERMAEAAAAPPPPEPGARPALRCYVIQLRGPLIEKWRGDLAGRGVRLLEHIPRDAYTARLTPNQVPEVSGLPFVLRVREYGPEDTGPNRLKPSAAPGAPGRPSGRPMITYDIRLHQAEDLEPVLAQLRGRGVGIAGSKGRKIRAYLLEDDPIAAEIAAFPEVAVIEEYVPPKLHNEVARQLLGVDPAAGADPGTGLRQTGDGEIVGVADTGLDDGHSDFQGRIAGLVALGRPNDASDPHGHGTHVAGSILGDGTASGGVLRGVAPKARLFFQSLLDADGGLGGLPLSLGDLFEEAYQAGARIHNNSWGSATQSMYTLNSIEVDEFVARRRDMLVVISAGNEGTAAIHRNTQPGFVDWLSIGAPASSKNALTVGASRTARTAGGYSGLRYGAAWPADFPDPPIRDELVSGNPDALAAFSSRGPCDDRRIKPDVVAPGTDIASAKSSRAPLRHFWGPYPGNPSYAFMGGTSMAAPLVAGCAALVREYYVKERQHRPSAALLKATLINSTRRLTGPDAVADHPKLPNFHQGFGGLYMPWAIPNPSVPGLRLEFVDPWETPADQFIRSGQRFRFQFSATAGEPLRIGLAWTDLPARGLQNNLNLFVQHIGTGKKWVGNEDLPMSLGIPDPDNNVELVRLENPTLGDYLIQVTATNLLQAPQDYALVVAGELTSRLTPV